MNMQQVREAVDNRLSENEKLDNCTCHIRNTFTGRYQIVDKKDSSLLVVNIDEKLDQVTVIRCTVL